MPIWFVVFLAICGISMTVTVVRAFRNGGIYVGGGRISLNIVLIALTIIVTAFIIIAAIALGFISDHAP